MVDAWFSPGFVHYCCRMDPTFTSLLLTDQPTCIQALPTREGTYIGVVLFRPDNPLIAAIKTREDAKAFFSKYYPQFVESLREEHLEVRAYVHLSFYMERRIQIYPYIGIACTRIATMPQHHLSRSSTLSPHPQQNAPVQAFATGPTFRLPTFSYAGPELHYRNNTVLMGGFWYDDDDFGWWRPDGVRTPNFHVNDTPTHKNTHTHRRHDPRGEALLRPRLCVGAAGMCHTYPYLNRSIDCIFLRWHFHDAPRKQNNTNINTNTNNKDAIVLDRCLDEAKDDLNAALPLYSKRRGPEAKALVEFQVRSQNEYF